MPGGLGLGPAMSHGVLKSFGGELTGATAPKVDLFLKWLCQCRCNDIGRKARKCHLLEMTVLRQDNCMYFANA